MNRPKCMPIYKQLFPRLYQAEAGDWGVEDEK